jgi:quercetin 2,3-dioxygenase
VRGSVESLTNTFMSVIRMPAGGRLKFDDLSGRKIFLYVVFGSVTVEGEPVTQFNIAELHDDGDALELTATNTSIVLFGYAETIDEPIAARGPFVMNTQAALNQAAADFHAGLFNVLPA